MGRLGIFLLLLVDVFFSSSSFAAKKDFKGLFGSYRRERFIENEARSTDFGFNVMLSTLFPVNPIVSSTESASVGASAMPSSNFFNVEGELFFSLDYNWQIFSNFGYFSFDTRRENTIFTQATRPLFQTFEMSAVPVTLGVKYRFGEDDIVPFVGVGIGVAWTTRKGGFDYDANAVDEEKKNCIVGQVMAGLEFYFHSRAGIRLEAGAYNFRLPERTFDYSRGAGVANHPIEVYNANPWLIRYSSGIFILL